MHLYGWLIDHLMHGSSYPLGGTSEIAYQTIPAIERNGGKVLVNAPVTKILMDDSGRAIGKRRMKDIYALDVTAKSLNLRFGRTKFSSYDYGAKFSIYR